MPPWAAALTLLGNTVYVAVVVIAALAAFLGLPGPPLVLIAGTVFCIAHQGAHPPLLVLLILLPCALVIELLDYAASMTAVRRHGGSKRTMWWVAGGAVLGALALTTLAPVTALTGLIGGPIGALVGAIVPPLAGGLLGGFLGGYWCELREGRTPEEARRAGWGALVGRLAGGLIRGSLTLVLAIVMLVFSFR